jgi:putative hydrolase of the HAD superfamily
MAQPKQTLLFDFGGTLDADGVAWKERFHAYYRAEGLDLESEKFAPAFFAADDPLVGLLPNADLAETTARLVCNLGAELQARFGYDATGDCSSRVGKRFVKDTAATLARNCATLKALKARYRLGVVSNFYGNLDAVCRGAGLASLFDVIVDSHVVGHQKPDTAIFRAAMEPIGAEPATTLMIGDSLPRDFEGARRCGMEFIWIAPERGRSQPQPPGQCPVIGRLTELEALLL